MNKKYLMALCITGMVFSATGCGKSNQMIRADSVSTETVSEDKQDSTSHAQQEDRTESGDPATTEAYENVTQVVSRNTSEKLIDSTGKIQVSVDEINGFSRNFGSPALIQLIGTGPVYTDVNFQLYEGYDIERVKKLIETFASSDSYGNKIQDKTAEFDFTGKSGNYKGYTLSYSNGSKIVYQMLLVQAVREDCILAINYQQDNQNFDFNDTAKLMTDSVSLDASGSAAESSTEPSSETQEEADQP